MIEATQRMLRYAVDRLDADWFVLLSGEHRPAVDLHRWESTIAAAGHDALFDAERLPDRLQLRQDEFRAQPIPRANSPSLASLRSAPPPSRPPLHGPSDETQLVRTADRVDGVHPSTRRMGRWPASALRPCTRLVLLPRLAVVRAEPTSRERSPGDRSGRRRVVRAELDPRRGVPAHRAATGPRARDCEHADHLRSRQSPQSPIPAGCSSRSRTSPPPWVRACRSCERSIPRTVQKSSRASTAP